jgi:hypothetical protein
LQVAVMSRRTRPSSVVPFSTASTWISVPASSSGTTTGRVNRTLTSTTASGEPAHSVTARLTSAIVNMPWAITPGSPTLVAIRSLQWIGLKSPDAPAYRTRWARVTR